MLAAIPLRSYSGTTTVYDESTLTANVAYVTAKTAAANKAFM